ncbi:MAG: flagellar assembly protein T N-terminal domain-containing protein [Gammaproteobacteria bacterium]|nr:flagellar assembly protein T N-terminal domain-containing protein [Gammaproteobacteria bacterium]MDH5801089.1 flagellar assembly protein T N-terminal domain-containing protein [Gammaproteobacteria bacterium]
MLLQRIGIFPGQWVVYLCLVSVWSVHAQSATDVTVAADVTIVEVKGQAVIGPSGKVAARKQAIEDAMAQAALQQHAVVQSRSDMEDHSLVSDKVSVRAMASVRKLQVLDEWIDAANRIYTVLIRAQVEDSKTATMAAPLLANATANSAALRLHGDNREPASGSTALAVNDGLRRSLAVTQFQIADRLQIHDMPDLEVLLAKELLQRLDRTGAYRTVDATSYLLSQSAQAFEGLGVSETEMMSQLARELGVQFLLTGTVRDMGKTAHALYITVRHVELEVQLWDGISGLRLQRHRFNASVWVDRPFDFPLSTPVMADKFFAAPVGQEINKILLQLVSRLDQNLRELPFSTRVVQVQGAQVFIDSGAAARVKAGHRFTAYQQGAAVFNARAGHWLGAQELPVATVLIKSVQPGFAVGEILGKGQRLVSGDILRYEDASP